MYDPQLGRFLERDPIRHGGGINLYRYGRDNPGRWTDPSGKVLKAANNGDYFAGLLNTLYPEGKWQAAAKGEISARSAGFCKSERSFTCTYGWVEPEPL